MLLCALSHLNKKRLSLDLINISVMQTHPLFLLPEAPCSSVGLCPISFSHLMCILCSAYAHAHLSNLFTLDAWVTWPEHMEGAKDEVKGPARLLVIYIDMGVANRVVIRVNQHVV